MNTYTRILCMLGAPDPVAKRKEIERECAAWNKRNGHGKYCERCGSLITHVESSGTQAYAYCTNIACLHMQPQHRDPAYEAYERFGIKNDRYTAWWLVPRMVWVLAIVMLTLYMSGTIT